VRGADTSNGLPSTTGPSDLNSAESSGSTTVDSPALTATASPVGRVSIVAAREGASVTMTFTHGRVSELMDFPRQAATSLAIAVATETDADTSLAADTHTCSGATPDQLQGITLAFPYVEATTVPPLAMHQYRKRRS
jgi:hypothetical protein